MVGIPDEHYGEELCACILPAGELDLKALKERLSRELPAYKVPRYFLRFESFPMTDIGKVRTDELKTLAIRRLGGMKYE